MIDACIRHVQGLGYIPVYCVFKPSPRLNVLSVIKYHNTRGNSSLKWLYSKLGLTQEFVVDCAHALQVVHSTKRLVTLILLKWFYLSFIYFMHRMLNENV